MRTIRPANPAATATRISTAATGTDTATDAASGAGMDDGRGRSARSRPRCGGADSRAELGGFVPRPLARRLPRPPSGPRVECRRAGGAGSPPAAPGPGPSRAVVARWAGGVAAGKPEPTPGRKEREGAEKRPPGRAVKESHPAAAGRRAPRALACRPTAALHSLRVGGGDSLRSDIAPAAAPVVPGPLRRFRSSGVAGVRTLGPATSYGLASARGPAKQRGSRPAASG